MNIGMISYPHLDLALSPLLSESFLLRRMCAVEMQRDAPTQSDFASIVGGREVFLG